ncbi:hypothetical protein BHE97_18660 [Aeromicrobium sp. PE09-221]|uniref:cytochrome c biogenesis protein CcsA n=1 Tax=Aeromicrobium sp. PE09-221 TaxID=1898043 RepID=UPI000B3EDD89|nr:cytochrome c biogenesis protein CcsA [Aeromicrobium sp. PE09-221]OUZ06642.1 hypothetical protein BHE97_18660 [Aeromicrobium sp. PE09-221]
MTWARLSDDLVVATMMILALAFCLYAVSMAQRTTRQRGVAKEPVTTPAAASSAAGGALEHEPEVGPPWSERTARIASVMVVMGLVLNAAAVLARGIAAERAPWGNMYEFAIVGSTAILGAYVAGLSRYPLHRLGIWVIGLVLVTLGSAVTVLYTPVDALIPVLDSYWLAIHVGAAIVSGGAFTVAAVTSAVQLVRPGRHPERDEMLERVSYGLIVFAFPVWTFAVIAGAVWAEAAWGRYWGWDPKETWAFITWVFYAAYLHAQSTAGWRGKRAAWFSIAGYIAFLFNFIGVNMWVGGLHSYAGV